MKTLFDRPDDKSIVIGSRQHSFEQRIKDVVTTEGRVVVRLVSSDFSDGDPEAGRNVLAFDADGALLWQIEDSGFRVRTGDGVEMPQGYTGIALQGNELRAFQPIGCDCTIDLDTGKILAREQTK